MVQRYMSDPAKRRNEIIYLAEILASQVRSVAVSARNVPPSTWLSVTLEVRKGRCAALLPCCPRCRQVRRSEEHTSELQSLMRISYAVFCLKKKRQTRIK